MNRALLLLGWCLLSVGACAPPGTVLAAAEMLSNGGFEHAAGDWVTSGDSQRDFEAAGEGYCSLRVKSGGAVQEVVGVGPGTRLTCTAAMKVREIRPLKEAGYAYGAVYQLDEFGDIVEARDFAQKAGTSGWEQFSHTFQVAPGCQRISIRCGLFEAAGTAWFDSFTLTRADERPSETGLGSGVSLAPRGDRSRVAVFRDDIPPAGAAASPVHLGESLSKAGFDVAYVDSIQLADRQAFNRGTFDIVVLPYGASFPVQAAASFRAFLREGGKFFSTGGYAFDNLLERHGGKWGPPVLSPPQEPDHALWHFEIPADDLRSSGTLTYSGFLKAGRIGGPGIAYLAVYQTAADGSLAEWKDICQVRARQEWRQHSYSFTVNPKAVKVDLRAGLYRCRGVACFDDILLTDSAGNAIVKSDFEDDFDPDKPGARRWVRSNPKLCMIDDRTRHSGRRAIKARLEHEPQSPERLNTRHGIPEDGLQTEPHQIGVFDPDYRLERVHRAEAAPGQCLVGRDFRIEGELAGCAASGVVGFNTARWAPILNTCDRYGRLRGAAGAILRNYAGYYAGSSWAFFGVTNRDLFAASDPAATKALADIVRALAVDTYFTSLTTERSCHRTGENVRIQAGLFNGGRHTRALRIEIEIIEGEPPEPGQLDSRQPVAKLDRSVTIMPAQDLQIALDWKPEQFKTDFYYVIGRLLEDDREVDRIDSGFVVWDKQVVASGPRLSFHDNYLRLGGRPVFMFGTDDWGYVFSTARETPLEWLKDMRQRRDFGVLIYENLQFGIPASTGESERLLRKVDGVAQLAQKYGQVYFPGLLIGYNVAASDDELSRQKEFCHAFARRYSDVPGLIYYLNGDLRCRLSESVAPQWNEFLRQRHQDSKRLREAWGDPSTPDIGSIPCADFNDWGHPWGDVRVYDLNQFRAWLIRRWCSALIEGIRAVDKSHPTSAEFYQLPHEGVDLPAAIDGLDVGNFGYFDRPGADISRFPAICKCNDQRANGKSVGPGEYGVKTHPAWGDGRDHGYHTARSRDQAIELFLAIAHYSLGLGASRIHNWCWKDDAHRVFPWGMIYPCDGVPKDTLYVHRNQSLLFRHFAPVYEEPLVYVLTPDSHRLGGGKWEVTEAILKSIDLALGAHVDNLGTLNEQSLDIPKTAKAIFYPIPFCPSDRAFGAILDWVKRGGVLYLSGDISYDESRKRTRTQRLESLCGVRFVRENYPNISVPKPDGSKGGGLGTEGGEPARLPCIRVEPAGAIVRTRAQDGSPVTLEHRLGNGRIIYTTEPLELITGKGRFLGDLTLYQQVLAIAGMKPIGIEPDEPLLHVFRLPLRDRGQVYVMFNTDDSQPVRSCTLADCHPPVALTVQRRRPALIWRSVKGELLAAETQGELRVGGQKILDDGTRGIILALDRLDLSKSRALLLMPLTAGVVELSTATRWEAPVAETGEIRNATWQSHERRGVTQSGAGLRIEVTSEQALSLLLVHEDRAGERWRKALGRAMADPASLP